MNTPKRNVGKFIVEYLRNLGRGTKKAGVASTLEIAEALGIPVPHAYSRLYWMETKDNKLESVGKGQNRQWRLAKVRSVATAKPASVEKAAVVVDDESVEEVVTPAAE